MKHNLVCANFVVLVYWRCLQPTVPLLQPPPTSRVLFNITTWAKEYNLGDPVAGVFFRATKGEYWSPLGNHVEVQSSNLNNTELSKYDSYFIDQALSLNFNSVSRHKMNKISLHFPSLICFLWLVRALENNLFLCPFVTLFGFCSCGSDLGPLSLFFLFPPSLDALFNGACQGFITNKIVFKLSPKTQFVTMWRLRKSKNIFTRVF